MSARPFVIFAAVILAMFLPLAGNLAFAQHGGHGGGHGHGGMSFGFSIGTPGLGGFSYGSGGGRSGTYIGIGPSASGLSFGYGSGHSAFPHYGGYSGGYYGGHYGGYGHGHGYHDWSHYFGPSWGIGIGTGWPGYGGWGYGGWGNSYPYSRYHYCYPSSDSYYYSYQPSDYASATAASTAEVVPAPDANVLQTSAVDDADQDTSSEALKYYSDARSYFAQGDYRSALRMAGHAAVEAPQNPKVHELISLALFATGNYRAAASEAHAAMAAGPLANWDALYAYYNDADKYTKHLRALEKATTDNPKSAAEHFLLGYHYLMTGAQSAAKSELAEAVKLTPDDKLAEHYLKQLQSGATISPPQSLGSKKPQGETF